jgi:hypothetical protein
LKRSKTKQVKIEDDMETQLREEPQQNDEHESSEEGQEVACEEMSPEEEEVKGEWPTGVPQASEKDLVKLSHDEGVGTLSVSLSVSHCLCLTVCVSLSLSLSV